MEVSAFFIPPYFDRKIFVLFRCVLFLEMSVNGGSNIRVSTWIDRVAAINRQKISPHSHCLFNNTMKRHASKAYEVAVPW